MLSIEDSLWPLTAGLKILGFHIGPNRKSSRHSLCLLTTGCLMVLSTVGLHCGSFVGGVLRLKANELGPNGTNLTTTKLLNIGIEHLNYSWVLIGVHVTFFIVSLTANWAQLWDKLLLIEKSLNFNPSFYVKCRKSVIFGFGLLFTVSLALFIIRNNSVSKSGGYFKDSISQLFVSVQSFYWDMGVLSPVAILLSNLSRTTIISVFLLFCVLARVITLIYQGLNEQIDHLDEPQKFSPLYSSSRILNIRLEKWRRNHTLACELVDMVNNCFGLVMVITVINVFVSFITTTFEIVSSIQEDDTVPFAFVFIFVKKSILLTIIIYEPYRLQAEVSRTAVALRKIHPLTADLLTQIKLNTVVVEVTHASPKITAMEFFDVNLRLLPTLIGSTLTYVAILHQVSSHSH